MLFDDIGPSLICLSSPELQLSLILHFLSFLGLPVNSALSVAPCEPGWFLESLSLLTQGKKNIFYFNQLEVYNEEMKAMTNIMPHSR